MGREGERMRVVRGEIEGKEVHFIQVTGAKEAGQCENCLGSNVVHKMVHKSMGIEEWCMDCNDEKFIEANGHQSFQIYTLWRRFWKSSNFGGEKHSFSPD